MTDPYMDTQVCVNRLFEEWRKHPRLIVACDFDDTVFAYHHAEDTHHYVLNVLRDCQKLGFYIVLWTASAPDRHDMMRAYMKEQGIEVSSINVNPVSLPFGNHGKIYYNILLDDRSGLASAYEILCLTIQRIKSTVS